MDPELLARNFSETNRVSVEFLISDAKIALTLLDLAATTENARDESRRIEEAHHAYRSILSFLSRLNPTKEQADILKKNLAMLKARLMAAKMPVE